MDPIRILEKTSAIDWDYDQEADVLYLSVGAPRPGMGVDLGDGIVLRYDEEAGELIRLTLIGLRQKLAEELSTRGRS
jgi:uncharacterized protein YuzE